MAEFAASRSGGLRIWVSADRARLLLAGAFVLWAVDQLPAPGRIALFLGDIVIATYVLDLFWIMHDQNEPIARLI